ncbi:hypothetical protein I0P04_001892 [Staphylococcus pseudintermedius]|nr:hypothetical protein [Staphylococcus pseudintermedius]EHT6215626.1 hypothetical protein [Staphylococcus pseudintermedius]MCE5684550.1 hypothetical protein [Staphylococcus pseudintermedius]HDU1417129.1 hypothetical protein [Staphylococcus pseudintermedius]
MKDLLTEIYEALSNDEVISKHLKQNNIKFFDYPNANNVKSNVIVIDEIISPSLKTYADNNPLFYEYVIQIDVFSKQNSNDVNASLIAREVILRVSKIMWQQFKFAEFNTMQPEFIKDYNLYRQSKQFKGRKYIKEMEQ